MPMEAEGKFDAKNEARGSGPFMLQKWTPSVGFEFKANPDWYEKGRPFLAGINRVLLPEYATALAQFEAGNLWSFAGVRQEDILRTKRAHPEMILRATYQDGGGHYLVLSQQGDSPLRDVRVRRAASMLIDRDAWIGVIYNADEFTKAGLPVEVRWNSHMSAGFTGWVDPRSKDMGEGGKYFQHNVEDAKKLLAAAGYDKKTSLSHFYQTNTAVYIPRNETLAGMLREGFNLDFRILDYQTEWRQVCQVSSGQAFNGFCYNTSSGFNAENYLTSVYTPEGKFRMAADPIPGITDLTRKIKTEIDNDRQLSMIRDLQRQLAMEMPNIHMPGYTSPFTLNWPWLENYGVFANTLPSARLYTSYWYNKDKQKAGGSSSK